LYFYALRVIGPWKLMVTLHGSDIYSLSKRTWLYRTLLGILLSGADSVIAGTAHLIQSVKAAYPRFTGRTRVIPNGNALVECQLPVRSAQQIELPERYILAVGNLVKRKGYDVLLRAVALARDRGHGLNLVLVGEGPEASSLAALAEQLKVQDRVVFVGKVPHREILPFYSEAQFFVHPAREEAQGLVLLEAMFSGKAVVATRVLGIPEVVRDGDTGLLVEPDDAESLASALIKLATDEALRDTLAERACAYVTREHTWGRFMTRYIAGYEAVIRGMTSDANPAIQRTELTKSSECPPTAL
jgi:glycosyltransferase involved in cell wall biosynthesis